MSLTIIIPTRGRPSLLQRTLETSLPNVKRDDTKILVCADEDDPLTLDCLSMLPKDGRMSISIKPREDSRAEKYDRALIEAPADIYLPTVDCASLLTPGFDDIIVEKAKLFPDGIGCVYTEMANASFPKLQGITARLIEKLGYMYCPDYPFWFIDHDMDDICRMIGRYICTDIVLENASMRTAKTHRLRDLEFWVNFFDLSTPRRIKLAASVVNSPDFDCPAWQKEMVNTWHNVVAARSWYISCGVVGAAKQIEESRGNEGPPDEGYVRLKAKAEIKMREMFAELQKEAA